jgi:hypothetical protein
MVLGMIHCDSDKERNHILGEQLFVLLMYHFSPHKIPQYEFVPILKTTHHYAYLVKYFCKKYTMKIGLKQHRSVAQNTKFLTLKWSRDDTL